MSIFAGRLGLALVLVALCLGGRTAHAQAAPVNYWIPGWPFGIGAVGENSETYGNFPSFDGSDARGGFSYARYNFPSGWFVGSERSGLGMSGINQYSAFGNLGSVSYEGMQFGYKFQNAVTVYGGFDALKYNPGIGGPSAAFEPMSGTLPGAYTARAGVQFQPAPNVSLSLGFDYTQQQSGRVDSDINSPLVPGASPFAFTSGRR